MSVAKSFWNKFSSEATAKKWFGADVWNQIKAIFSPCCGMGRKIVGLKDANGKKITIKKFPFTFDGTIYATKEAFEQAMSDVYGLGYSVNLIDCCHLMFIWNRGLEEVPDYIQEGVVVPSYNFDIEMDWTILTNSAGSPYPVTNQATFIQWLTNGKNSTGTHQNDFTNIVITNFLKSGDRIQCNLTADATEFALNNNRIVNANKIGVLSGLQYLHLRSNQIANFNPAIALPATLDQLALSDNQITIFDPTIPLPATLTGLYLDDNQIGTFDPLIALPIGLTSLNLSNNQIVLFNPSTPLPISLILLFLSNNQMTTAGYAASEAWANAQPSFTLPCIVDLSSNVNSASGTNLETILIGKNCSVTV